MSESNRLLRCCRPHPRHTVRCISACAGLWTLDLPVKSRMLCQLSYTRIFKEMQVVGFEPTAWRLKAACSAGWATPANKNTACPLRNKRYKEDSKRHQYQLKFDLSGMNAALIHKSIRAWQQHASRKRVFVPVLYGIWHFLKLRSSCYPPVFVMVTVYQILRKSKATDSSFFFKPNPANFSYSKIF